MIIPLSNSPKVALADDGWEEDLLSHKWFLASTGYPATSMQLGPWKYANFYLHQFIMGEKPEFEVDHINGDKLDNRTANLRHVTHAQNCLNHKTHSHNKSGYKGVYKAPKSRRSPKIWEAYIGCDNRRTHIGWFETFDEAYAARKAAEHQLHGAYARKESVAISTLKEKDGKLSA